MKLITRNPSIQFGAYTIRGTRICACIIKGMYKGGESIEVLSAAYNLTEEQVRAAINFRNPIPVL